MMEATHYPLLFYLQDDLGEIIGLISVVGFYVTVLVIALFFFLKNIKDRQFIHKERIALIERVDTLPENIHQLLVNFAPAKDRDLRNGLIWLIVGIGVCLTLYFLQETRPYWSSGLIPVFFGLAYLVSFLVLSKRQRPETSESQGVQMALTRRVLSERTSVALPEQSGVALLGAKDSEQEKIES